MKKTPKLTPIRPDNRDRARPSASQAADPRQAILLSHDERGDPDASERTASLASHSRDAERIRRRSAASLSPRQRPPSAKTFDNPRQRRRRRGILGFIGSGIGSVFRFGLAVGCAAAFGLGIYVLSLMPSLPSVTSVSAIDLQVPLRVYTAEGDLIAEYGDERRFPLSIDQVPKPLVDAILAAEDDGFYHHMGIDMRGIARAALANLRAGGSSQGASTITMQVARNYFLTPEKTYQRKLKEVLLALRLEGALSKDEILELYLNKIFLGHRAYGFAAAAKVYYNKPLTELSLAEHAMLAGLPKAPSRNNPVSNPTNAVNRRNYVLRRMLEQRMIDQATYAAALEEPITAKRYVAQVEFDAPYVAEMVRQHMVENYGDSAYGGGYSVVTTIRKNNQLHADAALRRGVMDYDQRHGYRGPIAQLTVEQLADPEQLDRVLAELPSSGDIIPAVVVAADDATLTVKSRDGEQSITVESLTWARRYKHARARGPKVAKATQVAAAGDVVHIAPAWEQDDGDGGQAWQLVQIPEVSGALVSLDPNSGAILALSGGFDYYLSKFNRATQAQRQPGSNIKPFIYSAAIDKGFTAASLISGAPIVVNDEEFGDEWRPENYSGKFFGPTRMRKALSLSLNLVSVRLLRAIGPGYARTYLERFGFSRSQLPKGLSLALGTGSATPLEIATAYAVFANGGYRVEPYFIARITDRNNNVIEETTAPEFCDDCNPYQTMLDADDSQTEADADAQTDNPESAANKPRIAPRVLDEATAFVMRSLMSQVIKSGTARAAKKLGRSDLAGKTGTTNDYNDAWFSGFNSDLVTTVWIGFDTPADLGRSEAGSKAALPIWIAYNEKTLPEYPDNPIVPPPGVVTAYVHKDTGEPTSADDPDAIVEHFVEGTEPDNAIAIRTTNSPTSKIDNGATISPNESLSRQAKPPTSSPAINPDTNTEGLF